MGIPGILKEIGKGERIALSKLAIEHLERHNRPLRIAIDAAIWNFQSQSGQGGKNPALRTLFFRFLRLLALPIHPVFVYDGKNKPLTKRGRTVTRYHGTCVENELSKGLVSKFSWPSHVAPGEAEAECAYLQKKGIVDMVMSQDVDAIMFGAGVTLRDWSKEGTKGNKSPTHINLLDSRRVKEISGLDPNGMILVALLSGGDYDESGVPGFGAALACEVARAGFGKDLIELVGQEDRQGLQEWRERLQYELETNESGYFKRRHKTLKVPDTFPDLKVLGYYLKPAVSRDEDLPNLEESWCNTWKSEIDVPALRTYTVDMFDWCWRSGARRFVRCFAQPIFQDSLRRGTVSPGAFSVNSITERRQHFINDGIPELGLSVVPADVVGIDIEAEAENPGYALGQVDDENEEVLIFEGEAQVENDNEESQPSVPTSPSKKRKSPPWDPNMTEKWWVLETLLQTGLPEIHEEWHQVQRDIRADPRRFAARKAAKSNKTAKSIDNTMRTGAIRGFFTTVNKTTSHVESSVSTDTWKDSGNIRLQRPKTFTLPEGFEGDSVLEISTISALQLPDLQHSVDLETRQVHEEGVIQNSAPRSSRKLENFEESSRTFIARDIENSRNFLLVEAMQLLAESTKISSSHSRMRQKNNDELNQNSAVDKDIDGSRLLTANKIDPPPPVPLSNTAKAPAGDENMTKVIQRKPRRRQLQRGRPSSSTPESPSRARRPIESFFQSSQETGTSNSHEDGIVPPRMPEEAITSSSSTSTNKRTAKSAALIRDSLPGTWKDLEAESIPLKRAPRVSYVDLTSD